MVGGKKGVREKSKRELLNMSEISLILDGYDDIFSDFDPRGYSVRALSTDFLHEAERASRDKVEHPNLILMTPQKSRNTQKEQIIKKRLKHHFEKHYHRIEHHYKETIRHGIYFTLAGISCMFIAVYILHYVISTSIWRDFLIVMLEPGGWFLFWEGLFQIIFESKKTKPELHFYAKMSASKIRFLGY